MRESKGRREKNGWNFGLVEKKGSGVFKGKGALGDAASLCRDANFSLLLNKQRGIRLVDSQ